MECLCVGTYVSGRRETSPTTTSTLPAGTDLYPLAVETDTRAGVVTAVRTVAVSKLCSSSVSCRSVARPTNACVRRAVVRPCMAAAGTPKTSPGPGRPDTSQGAHLLM